jgi:hypothetical protein
VAKEQTIMANLHHFDIIKAMGEPSLENYSFQCVAKYEPTCNEQDIMFLKSLPAFSDDRYNKFEILLHFIERIEFPKNSRIFEEGSPNDFVYLIEQGEIEVNRFPRQLITLASYQENRNMALHR